MPSASDGVSISSLPVFCLDDGDGDTPLAADIVVVVVVVVVVLLGVAAAAVGLGGVALDGDFGFCPPLAAGVPLLSLQF